MASCRQVISNSDSSAQRKFTAVIDEFYTELDFPEVGRQRDEIRNALSIKLGPRVWF